MARGTKPGDYPPYVRQMEEEIEDLKQDRISLQRILNFLFDTNRDWREVTTAELLELRERIKQGLHKGLRAAEYWVEITSETLIQHTRIAQRKMAQGLPDTQHVEFEDGRWKVPPGRDSWTPRPSTGFSRLDIALGWLYQLGLVNLYEDGSYSLTEYGKNIRRSWDKVYKSWE